MDSNLKYNELFAALSKAQAEMKPAVFDKTNPHFKNRYATLNSIIEATKIPFSKNGLSFSQMLTMRDGRHFVVTTICHNSGQFIQDDGVPLLIDRQNMQSMGSAITYAKRYGLSAMAGIVSDEDDDCNSASIPVKQVKQTSNVNMPDFDDYMSGK